MSLQARVLNATLKALFKRPFRGRPDEVARARARFGPPTPNPLRPPPDLCVTSARARPEGTDPRLARGTSEWVTPLSDRAPRTVLFLHGGGYFFCSPQSHRPITFALARLTPARVFALDYRLAPEHRFPAAVEDAAAAYRALLERGTSPGQLVVAGDSAGGGLAVATMLRARAEGLPLPAGILLFSPWVDLACTGESYERNRRRDAMFDGRESMLAVARLYLGAADPRHPLASPLHGNLAGLPPMWIAASDSEILLDDATALAARAREAGVGAELHVEPRLPHDWPLFARFLPEARQTLRMAARFVAGEKQEAA